jgi:glycosyltransferase
MLRALLAAQGRVVYLPEVLVKMRVGGVSNRSLANIWRKSRQDLTIIRRHRLGGLGTLAMKNLSKLGQFFSRPAIAPGVS